jgi:hypothetical protein
MLAVENVLNNRQQIPPHLEFCSSSSKEKNRTLGRSKNPKAVCAQEHKDTVHSLYLGICGKCLCLKPSDVERLERPCRLTFRIKSLDPHGFSLLSPPSLCFELSVTHPPIATHSPLFGRVNLDALLRGTYACILYVVKAKGNS